MLSLRPPIIVILGHVDHGKTTLLDFLRKTNIASKEAGGITQHIRSFVFTSNDYGNITFVDTPGHEAFSEMRKRGSNLADMAILVVAADDGVMPQTRQSISFIKEAGIPFIVAINKIDLSSADVDRVKTQLTEESVLVEDFGGQTPSVNISAKTGKGIEDMLELINLMTKLSPPQADPEGQLELVVLESRLDSKKGPLATVLVRQGTLKAGTNLFKDVSVGKVKALINSNGEPIPSALPSTPVEVLGLTKVLEVGSLIFDKLQEEQIKHASLNNLKSQSGPGIVNLIVKADFAGSLEAILSGIGAEVSVISSATGDMNENDVLLARSSGAIILGFNSKVSSSVAKLAETEKIPIHTFAIIYELFKFVDDLIHPKSTEQIVGKAAVLADFKINSDRIAGCRCTEGIVEKTNNIKILRGGVLIGVTHVKSLHQGKNTIEKVKPGIEFGALFSPYVDFKIGDDIIATIG
jgi:translation initiation factor IF-2